MVEVEATNQVVVVVEAPNQVVVVVKAPNEAGAVEKFLAPMAAEGGLSRPKWRQS